MLHHQNGTHSGAFCFFWWSELRREPPERHTPYNRILSSIVKARRALRVLRANSGSRGFVLYIATAVRQSLMPNLKHLTKTATAHSVAFLLKGIARCVPTGSTRGKRYKNGYKSKKPPSVNAEDRPCALADDSASLGFGFSFFVLVCRGVCLARRAGGVPRNERSEFWGLAGEPTCIKTSTRHGASKVFILTQTT